MAQRTSRYAKTIDSAYQLAGGLIVAAWLAAGVGVILGIVSLQDASSIGVDQTAATISSLSTMVTGGIMGLLLGAAGMIVRLLAALVELRDPNTQT